MKYKNTIFCIFWVFLLFLSGVNNSKADFLRKDDDGAKKTTCFTLKIDFKPTLSPPIPIKVKKYNKTEKKRFLLKPSILQLEKLSGLEGGEALLCEVLPYPKESLFIIIDQTVKFDKEFIHELQAKVRHWLKPGRYVEIITFSSSTKGNYKSSRLRLLMDPDIPEEKLIIRYENLYKSMHNILLKVQRLTVLEFLKEVLKENDPRIPRSDIVETLSDVSHYVSDFQSEKKIVLIISDMLENSDITSFYYRGHIRDINPSIELKKIEQAGLIGDFGGATIYVIGLGYFWGGEKGKKEGYLGSKLFHLKKFWTMYFKRSNAHIGELGTPMILKELD